MTSRHSIARVAAIAGREIRSIGASPFGVGAVAGLAGLAGAALVFDLRPGQARLDTWFDALVVLVGLLAVLVTTRTFAEEERRGSLEYLLTSPVTSVQVAVGKLLGTATVLAVALVGTVACPLLVARMGHPDPGPIITGYVGLVLASIAFAAVGCALSAATSNPLVSAAATSGVLLLAWGAGLIGSGLRGRTQAVLAALSPASHLTGFLRGTLGPRDVGYFVVVAAVGLAGTVAVLDSRR